MHWMHSFDVEMNNFVLFDLKMLNSLFTSVQKNARIQYFPWYETIRFTCTVCSTMLQINMQSRFFAWKTSRFIRVNKPLIPSGSSELFDWNIKFLFDKSRLLTYKSVSFDLILVNSWLIFGQNYFFWSGYHKVYLVCSPNIDMVFV